MAFQPVHDAENRRVRFLFDEDRGIIRHCSRKSAPQDYRIEAKEDGRYGLKEVDGRDTNLAAD